MAGRSRTERVRPRACFAWSRDRFRLVIWGAPGEIRTHTGRVLNPLPLPVGLRGLDAVTLRDHRTHPVTGPGCRARHFVVNAISSSGSFPVGFRFAGSRETHRPAESSGGPR